MLKLTDRLDNFAGLADASLDWQFMINCISNAQRTRPDFQLLSGTEYMVSTGAVGATSMLTSLAGVAPALVRRLYAICRTERYFEARKPQEEVAALWQVVAKAGNAGLKAAMRAMGRNCGDPRPPLRALDTGACEKIAQALAGMDFLGEEPRGWS